MNQEIRKSLVTGNVHLIQDKALAVFLVAFTEYAKIPPETRSLKFAWPINHVIAAIDSLLGDRLTSEITVTEVLCLIYVAAASVVRFYNQYLGTNHKGISKKHCRKMIQNHS